MSDYVKFDRVKDEPGAAYFMRLYGTCVVKPNGSMDCGGDCMKCFGRNWRPAGVKSHADMVTWHSKRNLVDREVPETEGHGAVDELGVVSLGSEVK